MPPLKPLVSGVRMARVMTTSSAFFWVLLIVGSQQATGLMGGRGESGVHCGQPALAGGKVAEDGVESFGCHGRCL